MHTPGSDLCLHIWVSCPCFSRELSLVSRALTSSLHQQQKCATLRHSRASTERHRASTGPAQDSIEPEQGSTGPAQGHYRASTGQHRTRQGSTGPEQGHYRASMGPAQACYRAAQGLVQGMGPAQPDWGLHTTSRVGAILTLASVTLVRLLAPSREILTPCCFWKSSLIE